MELEIGRVIEACDARVLVEPESRDGAVLGLYVGLSRGEAGLRVRGHRWRARRWSRLCGFPRSRRAPWQCCARVSLTMRRLMRPMLPALACSKLPIRRKRLPKIAAAWRATLSATVIGVTGSVGKTTTKGLVRDILSTKYETWATKGNFNNELGAPTRCSRRPRRPRCSSLRWAWIARAKSRTSPPWRSRAWVSCPSWAHPIWNI